ncbi:MAG: hypothetical protein AB1510_08640 [Bacillota bacterium]
MVERNKPLAVCFDFSGVIVDHRDKKFIPGVKDLIKNLHGGMRLLAVISKFPRTTVETELSGLKGCFKEVYHASKRSKLDCVREFAMVYGIKDLSRVAFVDDKPENLRAVAASPVFTIGFLGSGKYDTAAACKEIGIPYAANVGELSKLLGL